jgi:tRNA U34 5-methylaminomethyl-2-thiouridine-forming methyltransferase MnmC
MLGDSTLRHAIATFFGKPMHGQNEVVDTEIIKLNVFYGLFDAMPLEPLSIKFDYVFFDAFSPEANPDLWSPAVFERILKVCAEHCILATYGAASKARAAMAVAGWKLAKCRGALGKREMTLASPSAEALQFGDLKQLSTQRLIDRWLAGEFT